MTDSFVDSLRWRNDVLLVGAVLDLAGAAAVAAAVVVALAAASAASITTRLLPLASFLRSVFSACATCQFDLLTACSAT